MIHEIAKLQGYKMNLRCTNMRGLYLCRRHILIKMDMNKEEIHYVQVAWASWVPAVLWIRMPSSDQ